MEEMMTKAVSPESSAGAPCLCMSMAATIPWCGRVDSNRGTSRRVSEHFHFFAFSTSGTFWKSFAFTRTKRDHCPKRSRYRSLSLERGRNQVQMMVSAVVTARVLLWEVGSFAKKERDEQHYSTLIGRSLPPISHPGNRAMIRSRTVGDIAAGRNVACQTDLEGSPSVGGSGMTPEVIKGSLRPWGKRSKELPLTRHTPSSFVRRGQGHGTQGQ